MSHDSVQTLPLMACPLIVSPSKRAAQYDHGLYVAPFPGIDLTWEGFTFPHLHWIGINTTYPDQREHLIKLAIHHEVCHTGSSSTPFSKFKRGAIHQLYGELISFIKEWQVPIEVPIKPNISGNSLEKLLYTLDYLKRVSELVEEVIAIRESLVMTQKEGLISNSTRRVIVEEYKHAYGMYIKSSGQDTPIFAEAYDAFDFVVRKIGGSRTVSMLVSVFDTFNPSQAFLDIIFGLCSSDKAINGVANLPIEKTFNYFYALVDDIDPDGSRYRRKLLHHTTAEIERIRSSMTWLHKLDGFAKHLFDTPVTLLFSQYDSTSLKLSTIGKQEDHKELKLNYGEFYVVQEAVLQQLIQGIGLQCPFSNGDPQICCSRYNREYLEDVWSCTKPGLKCKQWERLGCLQSSSKRAVRL